MYVITPYAILSARLTEAISSVAPTFSTQYVAVRHQNEIVSEAEDLYSHVGTIGGTSFVQITPTPPTGTYATAFLVRQISIHNRDTIAHGIEVAMTVSSVNYVVMRSVLQPQQILHYNSATGWYRDIIAKNEETYYRSLIVAVTGETTNLTTGTGRVIFRSPCSMYLPRVPRASVRNAPTGAAIRVDIKVTGTSIFSSLLQIDANTTTSTVSSSPAVLSNTFIQDDREISIDIVQVGSSSPGTGLKVTFYYLPLS